MAINQKTAAANRQTALAVALLLFCGALWGATPMMSKLAGTVDPHPVGLSLMVNAMGAAVCATVCWCCGLLRWPTRAEWHFFFCWALLYSVVNQVLVYWLSVRLDAALVSVFTVLEGLVIFAAAALLRIEKPNLLRCCGLFVGLLGVMTLFFTVQHGAVAMPTLFMMAGLVIPISYAAESLFIATRRPNTVHPFLAVTLVMLCSVPYLFVLAYLGNDFMPLQFPPGRGEAMAVAIMLTTLFANLAFFVLIGIAGAVFAGQISYFNAICGIGWGVAVLGEKMPWGMFAAASFIVLGLVMVRPKCREVSHLSESATQPWPAE
jgi:drug/metabolite transporter (DMT)-like permease